MTPHFGDAQGSKFAIRHQCALVVVMKRGPPWPLLAAAGWYMIGQVDDLMIEGRAWSASEVSKYYSYTKGRFVPRMSM